MVVMLPTDILDDLCSRFLINSPAEERSNLVRICFQIEQAHWYYLDFYVCPQRPDCPNCGYREFARQLFAHCPFLQSTQAVDQTIEEWRKYKSAVPTYGAILLNNGLDRVLLVQGFFAKASWGFPKGKVNEDESPEKCAIREVREETNFDIGTLMSADAYLESKINEAVNRLYLVPNVPENFPFSPKTRNEIRKIKWFRLQDLPNRKDDTSKNSIGLYPNHFYTVLPFVDLIRKWVDQCYTSRSFGPYFNPAIHGIPRTSDQAGLGSSGGRKSSTSLGNCNSGGSPSLVFDCGSSVIPDTGGIVSGMGSNRFGPIGTLSEGLVGSDICSPVSGIYQSSTSHQQQSQTQPAIRSLAMSHQPSFHGQTIPSGDNRTFLGIKDLMSDEEIDFQKKGAISSKNSGAASVKKSMVLGATATGDFGKGQDAPGDGAALNYGNFDFNALLNSPSASGRVGTGLGARESSSHSRTASNSSRSNRTNIGAGSASRNSESPKSGRASKDRIRAGKGSGGVLSKRDKTQLQQHIVSKAHSAPKLGHIHSAEAWINFKIDWKPILEAL